MEVMLKPGFHIQEERTKRTSRNQHADRPGRSREIHTLGSHQLSVHTLTQPDLVL